MPVAPLRVVGDHDMWATLSQDANQLSPNRARRGFGEMLIPIAEYPDVSNAKDRRCSPQLGLSHVLQFLDAADRQIAARSRLASCRGDQRNLSSGIRIPPRETGCDETFVVRMREDQQDARRHAER